MRRFLFYAVYTAMICGCTTGILTSCDDDEYLLSQDDISVNLPEGGFTAYVDQPFSIDVTSVNDEGLMYKWLLDGKEVSSLKDFEYTFQRAGTYDLVLNVTQQTTSFTYKYAIKVGFEPIQPAPEGSTAYITQVYDFLPAVGQFTNALPAYKEGDTQEDMNRKVLESIGNNKKRMITLGGYGGYVVVGFDHTIENKPGLRDFRIIANAFYAAANPNTQAPEGGSCEPGIVMVAYDSNKNGQPDEHEWYEIEGSAHKDPTKELWYDMAVKAGNDVNLYRNYELTYYRPEKEPESVEEFNNYIRWEDNKGNSGYKVKNNFHRQPYFPQWISEDKITFKGTCLPQNGIDESGQGNYFVLYKFLYGYADNETNNKDDAAIDIDWAVNSKNEKVSLPGVDFIKVYTGVNQENGWLGENSTEITSIEDLHILGETIETR